MSHRSDTHSAYHGPLKEQRLQRIALSIFGAFAVGVPQVVFAAGGVPSIFVMDESRMFSSEATSLADDTLFKLYQSSGRVVVVHSVDDIKPKSTLLADARKDYLRFPNGSIEIYVVQSSGAEEVLADRLKGERNGAGAIKSVFDREMSAGHPDLALKDAIDVAVRVSTASGPNGQSLRTPISVPAVAPVASVGGGLGGLSPMVLSLLGLVVAIAAIGLYALSRKRSAGSDAQKWDKDLRAKRSSGKKDAEVVPISFDIGASLENRVSAKSSEKILSVSAPDAFDVLDSSKIEASDLGLSAVSGVDASPVIPKVAKGSFWNRNKSKTDEKKASVASAISFDEPVVSEPSKPDISSMVVPGLLVGGGLLGAEVLASGHHDEHDIHFGDIDLDGDMHGAEKSESFDISPETHDEHVVDIADDEMPVHHEDVGILQGDSVNDHVSEVEHVDFAPSTIHDSQVTSVDVSHDAGIMFPENENSDVRADYEDVQHDIEVHHDVSQEVHDIVDVKSETVISSPDTSHDGPDRSWFDEMSSGMSSAGAQEFVVLPSLLDDHVSHDFESTSSDAHNQGSVENVVSSHFDIAHEASLVDSGRLRESPLNSTHTDEVVSQQDHGILNDESFDAGYALDHELLVHPEVPVHPESVEAKSVDIFDHEAHDHVEHEQVRDETLVGHFDNQQHADIHGESLADEHAVEVNAGDVSPSGMSDDEFVIEGEASASSADLHSFTGFDSEFDNRPLEFDDGKPAMVAQNTAQEDDDLLKGVDLGGLNWDTSEEKLEFEREMARKREELARLPAVVPISFDGEPSETEGGSVVSKAPYTPETVHGIFHNQDHSPETLEF